MEFKDCLARYCEQTQLRLTEQQLGQFDKYFQMLIEKNKVMNLTAITEVEDVVLKHMLDSLFVYEPEFFANGHRVCDLGTGAGFPGVPLKIYQSDLEITLMDSLGKRLKWLEEVIQELQLSNMETCHMRAEDAGHSKLHREKYNVVVSRAVARLSVLAEYCLPLVKVNGIFAAMKAASYEQEMDEAQSALKVLGGEIVKIKPVFLPNLTDKRVIIYIRKTNNTPKTYPRRAGVPDKSPL